MADRILVVDDEPDLLELVRVNLAQEGYRVQKASSGQVALAELRRNKPDLLILDLMLPDLSGTDLCKKIRADRDLADLPIIMLTAKADEVDRVVGFEVGADDYVTKPFSPRELVLSVRAVLRRGSEPEAPAGSIEVRGLQIDPLRHRCFVDGDEVDLTAKEFDLLHTLMRSPGRVLSREHLLERVWGTDVVVTTRTIDTHLKRLREKMGSAGEMIETVRGVGYRFAE